ncbi:MAG: flagellar hook-length control protein FliK [Gammaproteobacteria bacterium]
MNGVVAPQDSLFPQASQTAVSGNKAFREALDAAAAQEKKIDVKQIDRDSLGSGGKARTDAQPALPEEAPIEAEGSSPLPQESHEIDGETQQAVDSGTQNETAVGNGLPTTERQPLPVVARLTGSGTVAGQASIQNIETPPPVSKLAGNSSAGSLTNNATSTSSTASDTSRLGHSEVAVSQSLLTRVTPLGLSPSKAEGSPVNLPMSNDTSAPRAHGSQSTMGDGLSRAAQGTALLSSLESATDSELSLMISGERGTARALEFGARTQLSLSSDQGLAMSSRPQGSVDLSSNAQIINRTAGELNNPLRMPLGMSDLDPARMTRMSLDGASVGRGSVSESASSLGLIRGETIRGQLERTRFSQSVDGEGARKGVDSALRLAKVEALVSELSSSAPRQVMAQSSTPSLLQPSQVAANLDPSLAATSSGNLSGQLAPKSLMPFTASASGIVNAKIDSAAWMEQIANHAKMAIKQDLRSVEIKLTPAHLGTIEILVAQDDESTQLAFFTKHAHVRDALESQLARLQKFFQEDGLELSDAWVSDQSLAEHRERQSAAEHGDEWPGGTLADGTSAQETLSATADQRQKPDPDRQLDVWA